MKRLIAVSAIFLAGCAGTPLSQFAHADLQNAQKIASTPERAAVWSAVESFITAQEKIDAAIAAQAKACVESLKVAPPSGTVGIATLLEAGSQAVNQVNANCRPIPLLIKP